MKHTGGEHMRKISSRMTFYYKWKWLVGVSILGSLWALNLYVFLEGKKPIPIVPLLLITAGLTGLGYLWDKFLVFDLMDAVYDEGHSLRVRKGRAETEIPLSDIINVHFNPWVGPWRVTLTLRSPCRLGEKIAFMPPFAWAFFNHPLAEELVHRIGKQRLQVK
jgi:hypothetical protein